MFVLPQFAELGDSEFRLFLELANEARPDSAALWMCRLSGQLTSFGLFLRFQLFLCCFCWSCVTAGCGAGRLGVPLGP